jgi:hypothetical protein
MNMRKCVSGRALADLRIRRRSSLGEIGRAELQTWPDGFDVSDKISAEGFA